MPKGANFTTMEDLMIAQSFVGASEDGAVGTDQNLGNFTLKMFEIYCKLVDAHNKKNNTRYDSIDKVIPTSVGSRNYPSSCSR
jgi:hypothetical protein